MYSKITHGVAVAMSLLAGFYGVSADFRTWIGELLTWYGAHVPHLLQPVPALAVALYMWYRNGLSEQGKAFIAGAINPRGAMSILLCACLLVGMAPMQGCTASNVLDTVISDLPVAVDIALSVVNIYGTFDKSGSNASLLNEIKEYSDAAGADLSLLRQLLQEYKAAPADDLLSRIDSVFGSAENHVSEIESAFHVTNKQTQSAIAAAVSLIRGVLASMAKILPPSKTQLAPRAAQVASSQDARTVKAKELAKNFNAQMAASGVNVSIRVP